MLKAIAQEQVTTKQRDGRLNVNRGDSYRNRFADKLAVSNFVTSVWRRDPAFQKL